MSNTWSLMWVAVTNSALKICVKCYEILVKKQLTWKGGEGDKSNRGKNDTSART